MLNSLERPIPNLIGIALTLQVNLGNTSMFTTLSLSAHERAGYLYLLRSPGSAVAFYHLLCEVLHISLFNLSP